MRSIVHSLSNRQSIAQVARLHTRATGSWPVEDVCTMLLEIINLRLPSICAHSKGVARMAMRIADELGLNHEDRHALHCAALVHDLGKLAVPSSILEKRGPLTEDEWVTVRQHPMQTYDLVHRIPGMENIAALARTHHERLDGSGYPEGLTRAHLTLPARILAVADVYDALSATRSYRDDLSQEQVLAIIAEQVPHALDARCFSALCRVLRVEMPPCGVTAEAEAL